MTLRFLKTMSLGAAVTHQRNLSAFPVLSYTNVPLPLGFFIESPTSHLSCLLRTRHRVTEDGLGRPTMSRDHIDGSSKVSVRSHQNILTWGLVTD